MLRGSQLPSKSYARLAFRTSRISSGGPKTRRPSMISVTCSIVSVFCSIAREECMVLIRSSRWRTGEEDSAESGASRPTISAISKAVAVILSVGSKGGSYTRGLLSNILPPVFYRQWR